MTIRKAELVELLRLLHQDPGLDHLRAAGHGDSITIFSGDGIDMQNHARLTRLGSTSWGLSFWHHTDRWERTPFVGTMSNVVETLVRDFSVYLEPW